MNPNNEPQQNKIELSEELTETKIKHLFSKIINNNAILIPQLKTWLNTELEKPEQERSKEMTERLAGKLLNLPEDIKPFGWQEYGMLRNLLKSAFQNYKKDGWYYPRILPKTMEMLRTVGEKHKVKNPHQWADDIYKPSELHEILECAHKNNKPEIITDLALKTEEQSKSFERAKEIFVDQIITEHYKSEISQRTEITSVFSYLVGDQKQILDYLLSLRISE